MPDSKGLFSRALIESGSCAVDAIQVMQSALLQGEKFSSALKCDHLLNVWDERDCLRNATVDQVLNALPLKNGLFYGTGVTWSPIVDFWFIPDEPRILFQTGLSHDVDLLLGTNEREGSLFLPSFPSFEMNDTQYVELVEGMVGKTVGKLILAEYPSKDFDSPVDAWIQVSVQSQSSSHILTPLPHPRC